MIRTIVRNSTGGTWLLREMDHSTELRWNIPLYVLNILDSIPEVGTRTFLRFRAYKELQNGSTIAQNVSPNHQANVLKTVP